MGSRNLIYALVLLPVQASALTVSLAANGGRYHAVETPVMLTSMMTPTAMPAASATVRPSIHALEKAKPRYSYSYTYTARRLSPCQEAMVISGNAVSTTWTPPANKAGEYTVMVTVVERIRSASGAVSENSATATTPLTITRRSGQPVTVTLSGSGPTVNVAASVSPPAGGPYTYHFRAFAVPTGQLGGYAQPLPVAGYDGDQPSMTGAFNWGLSPAVHVEVKLDAVSKSDCSLLSSFGTAEHSVQ